MPMFCFQCQETVKNEGYTIKGVCGKDEQTANLQDLLIYVLKGIGFWAHAAKKNNVDIEESYGIFAAKGLFTTITNVNFDSQRISGLIEEGIKLRDELKKMVLSLNDVSPEYQTQLIPAPKEAIS